MLTFELDDERNIIECTVGKWAENFVNDVYLIASHFIDRYHVKTIFNGLAAINKNFYEPCKPMLYETEIIIPDNPMRYIDAPVYENKYLTWNDAEQGHIEALDWLIKYMDDNNIR